MKQENFLLNFRKNLSLYSWALYDFANTIFSAVVLTFYFPLYLTSLAGRNLSLGLAATGAMVLAGLVVPWLGALTDRTGKTKCYLIGTTLVSVFFTALLSVFKTVPLLILSFLPACFFFHASLVFYYTLLPVVALPQHQGRASGLGIALGYLGVIFSIPMAHAIDLTLGRRFVFLVAAALFFLFSLPLFLWVPERRVLSPQRPRWEWILKEWGEVTKTLSVIKKDRKLLFFFLGNFFVMEAMNTVIFWLVIYIVRVFQVSQTAVVATFLALNFSAFVFGLLTGVLADWWGSHKTLIAAAVSFWITLLILAMTPHFLLFVAVSLLGGGLGFAGIGTAGRKRVLELVPTEEVGRYFGIYNLTTKISVVSSLIFSVLADQFGFRAALASLVIPCGVGVGFLGASRRNASRYPSS